MFSFFSKGNTLRIYVGNLSSDVTVKTLREEFEKFGQVSFVYIIQEKVQINLVKVGMVGMPFHREARSAIAGLNGKELKGKPLVVKEA